MQTFLTNIEQSSTSEPISDPMKKKTECGNYALGFGFVSCLVFCQVRKAILMRSFVIRKKCQERVKTSKTKFCLNCFL